MATRINPFEEIEEFFKRMSHQLEETSQEFETEPLERLPLSSRSMAVDVVEHDEKFVVTADLPGFERDEIDVSVTDHVLRITADRNESIDEHDGERYVRHERRRRTVNRSLQLPAEVDKENVEALMKNGVLSITLPKLSPEDASEVDIELE